MTLRKFAAENRLFDFDFSAQPEIAAGDTLTNGAVTQTVVNGAGALVLGAAAVNGKKIQFTIAGGTSGALYRITCQATTAAGRTIVGVGDLMVH
jgi:hypothetical protein